MAGRRPKPAAIHQLNGNPRHFSQAELNGSANPQPNCDEPEMPKGMSKAARREWRNIVPLLKQLRVLSNIDGKALAAYCESYALWETARNEYLSTGITFREMFEDKDGVMRPGNIKKNPAVAIANDALKAMKTFLIEFGLTPASRTRLKIERPKTEDDLSAVLNGRSKNSDAPIFEFPKVNPADMVDEDPDKDDIAEEPKEEE